MLNAGDDEWWQAAHVDANMMDGKPGLIPSRKRLEKRVRAQKRAVNFPSKKNGDTEDKVAKKSSSFRKLFKKNRKTASDDAVGDDDGPILTYEAVKIEQKGQARPVIILGPLKDDLNDMLVQEFPDEFAGCVPRKFSTSKMLCADEVMTNDLCTHVIYN